MLGENCKVDAGLAVYRCCIQTQCIKSHCYMLRSITERCMCNTKGYAVSAC